MPSNVVRGVCEQLRVANDDQRCRRKQLPNRDVLGFVRVGGDERSGVLCNFHQIHAADAGHASTREVQKLG